MTPREKVLVGYPVGGSVHPAFCKALCDLVRFEALEPSLEYEMLPVEYSSSLYVQENRNNLVDLAREAKAAWLLQIDSDESFEPHALRLLMDTARQSQAKIVYGLYANAQLAPQATQGGFYVLDMIYRENTETGEYQSIVPPSDNRPFLVDAAGSGMLLTHLSIYDQIPYPWFWLELIAPAGKNKPQLMNEDIAFSRKAREAGYQLWCDPRVEARHYKTIGLLPSTFRHFLIRAREVGNEMRGLS